MGQAGILILLQILALFPNITTPIERVELTARDLVMRIRGKQGPSPDIVIVAIDDFSFNWTGFQWPWPRSYYAEIIDQINKGGGKVVGVDIVLFEQDKEYPANDEALAKSLAAAPSSAAVVQLYSTTVDGQTVYTYSQPITPFRAVLDGSGISTVKRDEDAIVRSVQAFKSYNGRNINHWAFEIASLYLGVDMPTDQTDVSLRIQRADRSSALKGNPRSTSTGHQAPTSLTLRQMYMTA